MASAREDALNKKHTDELLSCKELNSLIMASSDLYARIVVRPLIVAFV